MATFQNETQKQIPRFGPLEIMGLTIVQEWIQKSKTDITQTQLLKTAQLELQKKHIFWMRDEKHSQYQLTLSTRSDWCWNPSENKYCEITIAYMKIQPIQEYTKPFSHLPKKRMIIFQFPYHFQNCRCIDFSRDAMGDHFVCPYFQYSKTGGHQVYCQGYYSIHMPYFQKFNADVF